MEYKDLLNRMTTPASMRNPNALMGSPGTMHRPSAMRSDLLRRAMQQQQHDPIDNVLKLTTMGIEGYKGARQAMDPNAPTAQQAAGAGSAVGAMAGAAGTLLPGWYGKLGQAAALLAGAYGGEKASQAKADQVRAIYSIADKEARQKAIDEARALGQL